MANMIYKYLHLANYKDIPNWSVQYADEEDLGFTKKYPKARIGSFLVKSRDIIEVQDDVEYKQVTLKINNGGVVPRNNGATLIGSKIGTKRQHVIHAGQFIMSKIDARNGAYGIVPAELEGAIVTNDFPVFDVDTKKIIPQFLVLVSTTDKFVEFARKYSSGTTNRKRIDIDAFLNQQIPLPSIEEQEKMVEIYNALIDKAHICEQEVKEKEKELLHHWLETLGIDISLNEKVASDSLSFTNLSSLYQWGVDFIVKQKRQKGFSRYYKCCRIMDLCKIGSGGTPSRRHREYYNGNIPWVKTGELDNNILSDTEEKITPEAMSNSSAKLYPKGCIIIAMYGATIGKTAKLGIEATTNQACAVLHDFDDALINVDYLWYYLQTQTNKFKELAYGGAQPNINAGIVSEYLVPLPTLDIQESIVKHTQQIKAEIIKLSSNAIKERCEAINLIQKLLFKTL